ncbi:hypothetical protein [Aeromonas allosaccharophila]|uniref:Uncharacterized protein n=1 Tax=Aeromonas allosaccharophila TaxID=656 RepID=A0AAX3P1C2_9GAMM|nr:hypothetical protein [Aeromonas allosaccharophila]WED79407.1 hypothetical protein PYU98_25795 [Aeromonas allosaccharophila]
MSRVRGEDMSQMQPCHPCHCLLGECRTELLPLLSEVSQAVSLGADLPSTLNLGRCCSNQGTIPQW